MDTNGLEKTRSLKEVIESEVYRDPFSAFVKYNLAEIRRSCLKRISEIRDIWSFHADWAEAVIPQLQNNYESDYWKELLKWYLDAAERKTSCGEDDPTLKRAIEFALSLSRKEEDLVSKLLARRLKEGNFTIEIYDEMPALKAFFHKLFHNLYWEDSFWRRKNSTGGLLRSGEYSDEIWHGARRAIEIVVLAEDFSLIDRLGDVIFLMEEGAIHSERFTHWSVDDERLGYLIAAERQLRDAKRNAAEEESEEEPE